MLKEEIKMARITRKQEAQFSQLVRLFHELIRAKHRNRRCNFEETIAQIHAVTEEESNE